MLSTILQSFKKCCVEPKKKAAENNQNKQKELIVCVTGAAGMISYSFIPMLCSGMVFGNNTTISLRLLDIPQCDQVLLGIKMEIDDCAYPLVKSVETGSDPLLMFKDIDVGIFIGGFPRKEGMERKELLQINGNIFRMQGKALDQVASKNVKVLVVANPANTNCLILSENAQSIPKSNFTAMTRLDQNRSISKLSLKTGVDVKKIKNVIVWGNHSATQYPDIRYCKIDGKDCKSVVNNDQYLMNDFIVEVQKRGAEIIKVKKTSSVFSAANAVKDHLKDWYLGNKDQINSMAVITQNDNSYGVQQGLCFSLPVVCTGNWNYHIVEGLFVNNHEFSAQKIKLTMDELIQEKEEAFS